MADNLDITQGTGTTIGADEISSVKYQRIKMILGADGTNDGDVCTANPMPISDAGGSVTVDGTVTVSATNLDVRDLTSASDSVEVKQATATNLKAEVVGTGTFAVQATVAPSTSGGVAVANFNTGDGFTALTNSAQAIKAAAGQLYGFDIYNPNVTAVYVMFYNVAAASVTVGTTGALKVICIPAGSAITKNMTHGIAFDTAMSIACATTGGGNTAPTTALEASVEYK
jgi:hypothetical protein